MAAVRPLPGANGGLCAARAGTGRADPAGDGIRSQARLRPAGARRACPCQRPHPRDAHIFVGNQSPHLRVTARLHRLPQVSYGPTPSKPISMTAPAPCAARKFRRPGAVSGYRRDAGGHRGRPPHEAQLEPGLPDRLRARATRLGGAIWWRSLRHDPAGVRLDIHCRMRLAPCRTAGLRSRSMPRYARRAGSGWDGLDARPAMPHPRD